MGKKWTTEEQDEFLDGYHTQYLESQKEGRYGKLWPLVDEAWFSKYPEIKTAFPDKSADDLTEMEKDSLKDAIRKRQQQLKTWFRWRHTNRARDAESSSKNAKKLFAKERLPQQTEVYSDMFGKAEIDHRVEIAMNEPGTQWSKKTRVGLRAKIAKEVWMEADEVSKDAINAKIAEITEKRKEIVIRGAEQYLALVVTVSFSHFPLTRFSSAIKACPQNLQTFLNKLSEETGWAFTVLMGGPNPGRGGEISVGTFHVGKSTLGNEFGDVLPDFDKVYMAPFAEFLWSVFPPEVCRERCRPLKIDESSLDSSAPSSSSLPSVPLPDPTSQASSVSVPSVSLPNPTSQASSVSVPSVSLPNPTSQASPVPLEGHPLSLLSSESGFLFSSPIPAIPAAPIAQQFTIDPPCSAPSEPLSSDVWSTNMLFALPPYPPYDHSASDSSPNNFAPLSNVGGIDYALLGSAVEYQPTFDPAWLGGNFLGGGSLELPPPAIQPTTLHQGPSAPLSLNPIIPLQSSTLPSVSAPGFPCLPILNQSITPAPLVTSSTESTNLPSASASPLVQVPVAPDQSATPAASAITAPPDQEPTPVDVPVTNSTEPPTSEASRRSRRPAIPSTRAEKMNEIGSKDITNKENQAALNASALPTSPPEWMRAAQIHLSSCDLGEDWRTCVETWVRLEGKLEFGLQGKGALPATKQRPCEWAKWTAKARNGQRCYSSAPVIKKPAEFGHAVAKWWNDMQPAFRKGVGELPKNTYDDGGDGEVWLPLRKGGPNGLLSVLTLLAWWGQCLTVHTQWEERTDDMWKATVLDVTQCLQKVMDGRRKRICDDDDNRSTKRAKTQRKTVE